MRFGTPRSRALANKSSARVTVRNPAKAVRGAVAVHRYDHGGSSPAWILMLRASLLKVAQN